MLGLLLLACPGHAAWMVPPAPYKSKDFTVVKRDGWFHCFYILSEVGASPDTTERELGHAISRDLYLWTQLPPVLQVRPDNWDGAKVWAPSIVERDSVYYMFYTGVTNVPGEWAFHQRIGLATSTDLMTWNRLDEPILSCSQVRWTYCDLLKYGGGEFRDPFVMPDPAGQGWIMLYTATPLGFPGTNIVGTAFSSGDFTDWRNGPPLWITHTTWSGSWAVESPHVFVHDGLYYLVFTGGGAQPLRLVTGPDPIGAPETWTNRGTLASMLGLETGFWFASEYFRDGTHEYFCFVNYDRVDFREILWTPGWQFLLRQPDLFHVWKLNWSASEVAEGEPVRLQIHAVNTLGSAARIEAFEVDADGGWQAIPLAEIGLPDSIPMTGLTTEYSWTARAWPDPEEPHLNPQIVVRLKDQTAQTTPITVITDLRMERPWSGTSDRRARMGESVRYGRARSAIGFRALTHSPLGRTALLVELEEAASVRLEIFDLGGRRVRALAQRALPAGATVIPWDGREDSGAPARAGVYFARLVTPDAARSVRLLHTP